MHVVRVAVAISLLPFTSSASAAAWLKSNRFEPDAQVVYKTVDGTQLKLHIFYPNSVKPTRPTPAIVLFHGGGFAKGDPCAFYYLCDYLASRGMVAVSAQYRLGDQLACLKDAKSAMRFVRRNADGYGIDPTKIAAGGGSAGGHLAAACATSRIINEETDDLSVSAVPAALVLFNPVLGHAAGVNGWSAAVRDDFRPYQGIRRGLPPTLCVWGEQDKFVPVPIMKAYQQKLRDASVRCEIEIYPEQRHSFFDDNQQWVVTTVRRADVFLHSLGLLEGEPTIEQWAAQHAN
jgi:acetyl esterase/lipase